MIDRILKFLWKRRKVNYMPMMMKYKDKYYYVDNFGRLWKLTPNYDETVPFIITLEER